MLKSRLTSILLGAFLAKGYPRTGTETVEDEGHPKTDLYRPIRTSALYPEHVDLPKTKKKAGQYAKRLEARARAKILEKERG